MWPRETNPYLLLLPAATILGVLFLGGLGFAFRQSLGGSPFPGDAAPSLEYYRLVLTSPEFRAAFGLTLYVAGVSTLLACGLGLLLATSLASSASRTGTFLARLPLFIPHTVAAYLTIQWLSQGGLAARLLHLLGIVGLPRNFPPLVNDPASIGIILTYVWKEAPFAALLLYPPLVRAGGGLLEVASALGADGNQRLKRVILPLVAPSLGAVALIIFAYTFGAYEVPYLLGQTYPPTLPVAAMDLFTSPNLSDRPIAMVYNFSIALFTGLVAWIYLGGIHPRLKGGLSK